MAGSSAVAGVPAAAVVGGAVGGAALAGGAVGGAPDDGGADASLVVGSTVEVVGVVEHDSAPGTVVEVLRPGYGQGSSQLRPAAVVVSRREE